jgi:hypothetical protein
MRQQGYGYAIVGGVGPTAFYSKAVGAVSHLSKGSWLKGRPDRPVLCRSPVGQVSNVLYLHAKHPTLHPRRKRMRRNAYELCERLSQAQQERRGGWCNVRWTFGQAIPVPARPTNLERRTTARRRWGSRRAGLQCAPQNGLSPDIARRPIEGCGQGLS